MDLIGGRTRDADDVRKCDLEYRKCDGDDEERGVASRVIGDDGDIDSRVPIFNFELKIIQALNFLQSKH